MFQCFLNPIIDYIVFLINGVSFPADKQYITRFKDFPEMIQFVEIFLDFDLREGCKGPLVCGSNQLDGEWEKGLA